MLEEKRAAPAERCDPHSHRIAEEQKQKSAAPASKKTKRARRKYEGERLVFEFPTRRQRVVRFSRLATGRRKGMFELRQFRIMDDGAREPLPREGLSFREEELPLLLMALIKASKTWGRG